MDSKIIAVMQRVNELLRQRRVGDASAEVEKLAIEFPHDPQVLAGSADLLARLYDYPGFKNRLDELYTLSNVPAEAWVAMAKIARSLRRPEWSELCMAKVSMAAGSNAESHGELAMLFERMNRLDHASEAIERGLRSDPTNLSCLFAKARICRRQKDFDSAYLILEKILASDQMPLRMRISAIYEVAQLHDAQDECESAITALTTAKQMARSLPDYAGVANNAVMVERLQYQLLTTLDADFFTRIENNTRNALPFALLAGHPRSGTTLLENILDSNTGVISSEETDVYRDTVHLDLLKGFDRNSTASYLLNIPQQQIDSVHDSYLQTMQALLGQPIAPKLLIDKNPSLTDYIPIFARVFPEASFIIALRDPRDVVLSCFFQNLPVNVSSIRFGTLGDTARRYANTMAMWLICRQHMNPRKWIEVRYESLVSDLPGQAERLTRHLNLELQPDQLQPERHAKSREVSSPSYADVIAPVHSNAIGKWKRYERFLADALPILDPFLKAFGY